VVSLLMVGVRNPEGGIDTHYISNGISPETREFVGSESVIRNSRCP
jgi:hypothetical protein